jgi:hypothetical protein
MKMLGHGSKPLQNKHGQDARDTTGFRIFFLALAILFVGSLISVAILSTRDPAGPVAMTNPVGMVDRLDFFDTSAAWSAGKLDRLSLDTTPPARLTLHDTRNIFPREGTWLSPETRTETPFTELLPSWNPDCPPETGLRLDVRTRDARTGQWSPWFYLGSWGRTTSKAPRDINNDFGRVHIDWLDLHRPADAYQARVTFNALNLDPNVNPSVRRLTVSCSGVARNHAPSDPNDAQRAGGSLAYDIPVPFRAQGLAAKPLRPEICSPTSVSMVMQYLGLDRPTEENALAIYDAEYDMFGNWGRAVAWAGQNGFDAWLTRYRNFEQVRATLSTGQPIIASIRFKRGEAPSFVMKETRGHLIVIRGITPDGDLIVNDPASKDKGHGAIYKSEDMNRAWLNHGGVGYIIRKPRT